MRNTVIFLSGASLIAALPTLALAQAGGGAGAAGGSQGLSINASAQLRHDSNIARTNAATAAQRGLHRSDQKFSPSVNLSLGKPFGPHNLTVSASAGYDFHRHNDRLDRERIQGAAGLALNLGVCAPTFNGSISRRQSELGEVADTFGNVQTVGNAETSWSVGSTVSCGKSFGLRPTAGITYQDNSNSNAQRRGTDKHITSYQLGLGYVHPSIGDIQLFAQQRDLRFDDKTLQRGNRQRSYGVSFTRNLGARLTGNASINWTNVKPLDPNVRSFKGVNWSGNLSLKATPRIQVQASLGKSITSSLAVDSNYNISTNYGISASYAVSPRINFNTGYSHTKRRFEGNLGFFAPGTAPVNLLTNDKKDSIFAAVDYLFSPKLKFILNGGHDARSANAAFYDYKNNYVGLTAELSL
ncbi:outer membrane beta-barrel protein [Sphingobium sp. DEHP117]|uniref:outer membrane beta-barrel protein n=1 Tax=Sphingobium sp. DEHP117 TaxID=2993436 RepID=UPI0027D5775B|nr:outer membrane beta-barrel protein [Sphingobium sp. DEHP117]MDQ4420026.1 outer membrane beta-barrel protein [Sphingobium sp. DEHP117]